MPGIGLAPGPMAVKDVGDLQPRGGAPPPSYTPGLGLPTGSGASRSSGLVTLRIVVLARRV